MLEPPVIVWMVLKVGKLLLCCKAYGCCAGLVGSVLVCCIDHLNFKPRLNSIWFVSYKKIGKIKWFPIPC
jgi:hypothetical protein